ncbi:MAG: S1 RNA-binding domain-containing protein, partial [Kiritimatiellaeota bacterium]|nr:S1 RNA-binding domain-containing protein [Kiritimatiellota bacterium]
TLRDIIAELAKPGRDPRKEFEAFAFAEGVSKIEDLKPGMKLPGVITNVTNFGAFVDIGVHQDGLVHISELSDKFVSDPNTIVKVGQRVTVTVQTTDPARKRIALSMKSPKTTPTLRATPPREGNSCAHGEPEHKQKFPSRGGVPEGRGGSNDRRHDTRPPIRSRSDGFNNAFEEFFKK